MPTQLDAIKQTLQQIKASTQYTETPQGLKHQVIHAYYQQVIRDLEGILDSNHNDQLNELTVYLANNWKRVNGTLLSYTALPESDITLLLVKIARYISHAQGVNNKEKRPPATLSLLMPTISMVPVESLEEDEEDERLSPTWDTEKNEWVEPNVLDILKTYIQGRGGHYLIPVTTLLHTEEESSIYAPYMLKSKGLINSYGRLNDDDYQRLYQHSNLTRNLYNAITYLDQLTDSDNNNLYTQLKLLTEQLHHNGAHGGRGTDESAASGAYPAIVNFMAYYKTLGEDLQSEVPAKAKSEIDDLISYATDPKKAAEIGSCIGARADRLKGIIRENEAALRAIHFNDGRSAELLKNAEDNKQSAHDALKKQLDKPQAYSGQDALLLTNALFSQLKIKPTVKSAADLEDLFKLEPAELHDILDSQSLQTNIIQQITTFEDLVMLCHQLDAERLRISVDKMHMLLGIKFIKRIKDLTALLISFNKEKALVLVKVGSHLVNSPDNLSRVLIKLNPEHCQVILDACQYRLPRIITSAHTFERTVCHLTYEQRQVLFDACQAHLPQIIGWGRDLMMVLYYLTLEQTKIIVSACQERLPQLIPGVDEFQSLLGILNREQRQVIFEAYKDCLLPLITSAYHFARALYYLADEQRQEVFDACQDRLPQLITSGHSLLTVLRYLPPEQAQMIANAYLAHLPQLITSADDFERTLHDLTDEQRQVVFDACQTHLPQLITSAHDFESTLQYLTDKQRQVVFDACQTHLPQLIGSVDDFSRVLRYLTLEQAKMIASTCKERLPQIITSADDFERTLQDLTDEQRQMVFDACQDRLPQLIRSVSDFSSAIRCLTIKQRQVVLDARQDLLPELVNSKFDFSRILSTFPGELCTNISDRVILLRRIGEYLRANVQRPDDHHKTKFTIFADTSAPTLNFEDSAAAKALFSVIMGTKNRDQLEEHLGPLNNGELGEIYKKYCQAMPEPTTSHTGLAR